jgi:hypothetical protein
MKIRNCQRILSSILLALVFATEGSAEDPAASQLAGPALPEHLAIELDHPVSDQHVRELVPRVRVSGRAGSLPFFESDVVLLIDHSTLAALASGIDIDGDGVTGRNRMSVTQWEPLAPRAPLWTTDSGDTLQEMELRIARALVGRLADRKNRVGLVSFTFRARPGGAVIVRLTEKSGVSVPVGEPDAVLAALADFPQAQEHRWTNLTRLIDRGVELLDAASPDSEPARSRAIVLLSLGEPSAPNGVGWSARSSVVSAGDLQERGVTLWVVPLRRADTPFLSELASESGGQLLPLDQLDAQFSAPIPSDLRPRELEIENVTSHARATNLRVFPDGRFDAMVPLEPGSNTLEIRAVLADGQHEAIRRVVHYEAAPAEPTD